MECHANCKTCSRSSKDCDTCIEGYDFIENITTTDNYTCVTNMTLEGYFLDTDNKYYKCHDSCYSCDSRTNKGNCTACSSNFDCPKYREKYGFSTFDATCKKIDDCIVCSDQLYFFESNKTCSPLIPEWYLGSKDTLKACHENCSLCIDEEIKDPPSSNCFECKDNYAKIVGTNNCYKKR